MGSNASCQLTQTLPDVRMGIGTHTRTAHTCHAEQQGDQSANLAAGLMDSRRISHLSVKASTMAGSTSGYTCVKVWMSFSARCHTVQDPKALVQHQGGCQCTHICLLGK